jgi:hypothetical protein
VNPGAVDLPPVVGSDGGLGPMIDSDCSGHYDPPVPCDDALALDSPSPWDAAMAVELCQKQSDPKKWGLRSAAWVLPDGTTTAPRTSQRAGESASIDISTSADYHLGHGNLSAFGPNQVQAGKRMLALSSGTARAPGDPGYRDVKGFDKGYTTGNPAGFPKESPACPGVTTGAPHDGAALEVVIHTPSNAGGFSFAFDFFTYAWPNDVCSPRSDAFVALLSPVPEGHLDGNIAFDFLHDPVNVNNAFLQACGCAGASGPPCIAGGKTFPCILGDASLQGTGFGRESGQDRGSTGWLASVTSVYPSSDITLRWTVYDAGDGMADTTTLIDGWAWLPPPSPPSSGSGPCCPGK